VFPPRLARPCSRNRIVAFYACACALTVCRLSAYVRAPLPLSAGMPCTMLQLCMHAPHATFDKLLLRTAPSRPCAPAPGGRLRRPCGACGHWRDTCITKRAQNDFYSSHKLARAVFRKTGGILRLCDANPHTAWPSLFSPPFLVSRDGPPPATDSSRRATATDSSCRQKQLPLMTETDRYCSQILQRA
jgi:hypothetical protein